MLYCFQKWLFKQEEVMELKQELTKLELTGEELSTVQRGHRSVVKSEPEVSCVCANISTTSVIRTHTHV